MFKLKRITRPTERLIEASRQRRRTEPVCDVVTVRGRDYMHCERCGLYGVVYTLDGLSTCEGCAIVWYDLELASLDRKARELFAHYAAFATLAEPR